MKKFFKVVLWTFFILVLIAISAIFVFIKTFDLNKYKSQISTIVYEQTGRELKLNGHVGLKISLIPTLELNDVSFANASWSKEPNMIEAKTVDVSFSVMPLLNKEIVIDKIHLIEPKVYLLINEKGISNWDFSENEKNSKQADESQYKEDKAVSGTSIAQGAMIASFVAKSFKIENGEILYQNLKTKERHDVKIKNIAITSEGMNDNINAVVDVMYNDNEISANINAGSINSILKNEPDYPIKANIQAFGVTSEIEGTLSELLNLPEYDLSVIANNPNGNMGIPDIKLSTGVKGNLNSVILDIASLNVASNDIKGTVELNLSGKKPKLSAKLNASLIDLQKFTQIKKANNNFYLISTAHAASFVPQTDIDLSVLSLVNANAQIDIQKLIVNDDISLNNVKTDISINDGNAKINIQQIGAGEGIISGTLSASAKNTFNADITGNDIILQNVVRALKSDNKDNFGIISGGKTKTMIKLSARGKNLRDVVESLNGQAIIVVDESKIQMGTLKYLRGDFISQILNALKLKQSEKNLDVSCVVLRTDIKDGKAFFPKGLAFKSNKITVVSDGFINLKNDKLDLSIKPFNGKLADTNVAQAISSMLKVTGTIQKPRLTIDNSSVIKNVVGIAAAGPAFLGSQFLLDVDEYPCYTALKGTSYENMYPAPSGVKAAGQSLYQGANDVVSGGVNLVNDAAKGVINFLKGKK